MIEWLWNWAWWREQPRVIAEGLLAIRDSPGMVRTSAHMWHLARDGGIMIATPDSGEALMSTLIQPDGDMILSVSHLLLGPAHRDDRDEIAWRHRKRVHARLAPLHRLVRGAVALDALLLLLRRVAIGVGALVVPASGGAWLAGYGTLFWAGVSFATTVVVIALRRGVFWLIRRKVARMMA